MAFVSKEEREKYYNTYPPGTRVLILDRQEWLPGEAIDRFGESGTVKIKCKMDSGEEFIILYGRKGTIRLA